MHSFIDPEGSFVTMHKGKEKDSAKLGKVLAKLTGVLPIDMVSLINKEGGPVVITQLDTKIAKKFAKVALFEGFRLDVRPMSSYFEPPELTPRRIELSDIEVVVKSETPGAPDVSFPSWDIRFLRVARISQEKEEGLQPEQEWTLRLEDVRELVAELTTPEYRVFFFPNKMLYSHLDPPGANSAVNFHSTLVRFLEMAPACDADPATRAWCEQRPASIPTFRKLNDFKTESLGHLQLVMA